VVVAVLFALTMLSACGTSAGDAEQAITDRSHERLTEPECEEFDRDMGEKSFECSAANPGGRRIKVMVSFGDEEGGETLILEWPCVSAGTRWKALREHAALRCGRPL
jgi:hypothetical protein